MSREVGRSHTIQTIVGISIFWVNAFLTEHLFERDLVEVCFTLLII